MTDVPFILRAIATVLLVATLGCNGGEAWNEPGPKDTFDAFLMHWFRGERELAFGFVLPEDRDVLTKPLEAAADLSEQERPKPWEMLVVAEIENVYDISKMEVSERFDTEPPPGQSVILTVHHQDGTQSHAKLVWDAGRWYVDLPLAPSGSEKK